VLKYENAPRPSARCSAAACSAPRWCGAAASAVEEPVLRMPDVRPGWQRSGRLGSNKDTERDSEEGGGEVEGDNKPPQQ